MIVEIAGIQETADVRIERRCALVFCADHGVVAEGVSQSGSEVTALVAARICPEAKDFMLPSHMSREPAAIRIMDELELKSIVHADMALGEGTGAAALLPLLDMALRVYHGPHTFDDLGMDAYTPQEGKK